MRRMHLQKGPPDSSRVDEVRRERKSSESASGVSKARRSEGTSLRRSMEVRPVRRWLVCLWGMAGRVLSWG